MRLWCAFALLLSSTPAIAQHPVGEEFQVNSETLDDQQESAVSVDGSGGFVVVWRSDGPSGDGSFSSIEGQRFGPDGGEVGTQFQVNTYTPDLQFLPAVSPDGSGGFVVVWASYGSSGSDNDERSIQARRFDANGSPLGADFQVNTDTFYDQSSPAVSPDGSGGFVVAWQYYIGSYYDPVRRIKAQRFDSEGDTVGPEFQVDDPSLSYYHRLPAVSEVGAGGFVVVWQSDASHGTDDDGLSIQARRFDSGGSPAGAPFQVNSYTTGDQEQPTVIADGAAGFVVAWRSDGSYGNEGLLDSIQAQRFDAEGDPIGAQFQVNSYTSAFEARPAIAPDGSGGFLVAWDSSFFSTIRAQRFDADWLPVGGEFQVNSYSTGQQLEAAVSPDGSGRLVVVWTSGGSSGSDNSGTSVQAKRVSGAEIFADGFESGDTSAWSTTIQ